MKKVFLGGTCNGSTWRDELIPLLTIAYYNPVVPNWAEADKVEEIRQRAECDLCLYVITPEQTGFYSFAEVAEDSVKNPRKTVFAFWNTESDFTSQQMKSLLAIGEMVERNGAVFFNNPYDLVQYLNNF